MNETQLDGKSADIVSQNIEQLKQLFPEVFTEDKIDFERLQEVLGEYVEDKEERYRFDWHGKSQALRLSQTPSMGTLRPCKEESKDWDTTQNLYIEGDNLEVLKLLQKSYYNKVKMIYIDPPYNTGNDFVYKDDFKDGVQNYLEITGQIEEGKSLSTNKESGGRYHTDWLNMLYPRLRLARNLLTEDGVIFLSIDDNEVDNLKKICGEIFGDENFISVLVWEKKKKGSFLSNNITNIKEYILVIAKNKQKFKGLIGEIKSDVETYPCINASNKREKRLIPKGIDCKYKDKNFELPAGSVISDTTMNIKFLSDLIVENGVVVEDFEIEGNWRYSQEKMSEYGNNKELYITRDRYIRRIVSDKRYKTLKDLLPRVGLKEKTEKINLNNLFENGWGSNEDADEELRLLFGKQRLIDYPKPSLLLAKIICSVRDKNMLVMDFFSGSSTTAEAVIKLNSLDNGRRQFIMVQLPEISSKSTDLFKSGYKNLCEFGKERIRRAGEKIKNELQKEIDLKKKPQMTLINENNQELIMNTDDLDIGFKVFKLDNSNLKKWNPEFENLKNNLLDMVENFVDGRTEEDVLYEIMLKYGLDLTYPVESEMVNGKTVYNIGYGMLFVCMSKEIDMSVAEYIIHKRDELIEKSEENEGRRKSVRVVFLDNGFKSDDMKTNVKLKLEQASFDKIVSV